MQLSIIIVNYNVKYFLEQCLASVIKAAGQLQAEILVVDNCSTDGSKEFFKGRFPEVKFIWHCLNTGFSAANNLALKQAVADKILFLNPDTILPEDCLVKCLTFFDSAPNIGAAGIRMLDGGGIFLKESKRGFASALTSFFKMSGLTKAFPSSSVFARYYLGHLPEDKCSEVDVLSGAFMMVSKAALNITGGFDEAFFMYGEDIDLSYRIQKAGFKNFYFADSSIIHFKGESTKKNSPAYISAFYGAMELFVKKHYSKSSVPFYRMFLQATILAKKIAGSISRQSNSKPSSSKSLTTLIVADSSGYNNLKSALEKKADFINVRGRVAVGESADAVTTMKQLPAFVSSKSVEHIIFCDCEISISDIIKTIEQLPKHIQFYWHLTGTSSIINSNNKNKSGFWVALDQ